MKNIFSFCRVSRLSSLAFVFTGIILQLIFAGKPVSPLPMTEIVLSGTAALVCCRLPHENHVRHLVCSLGVLAVSLVLALACPGPAVFALVISGCMAVSHVIFVLGKYRQPRFFFSNIAVWHNIEDNERSMLLLAFMVLMMLFLACLSWSPMLQWTVAALCAAGFVMVYLYLYFEWYMFVGRQVRSEIRRDLRGRLQPVAPIRDEGEKRRMEALYSRIKDLMEEQKPYLDPELSETKMASMVFSNQNYLSRTVNTMSNLNFKQFLNSYRVQYAEGLMRKDPRMQVKEIASLSGFNSTPSFNMAFKLFKGITPGKYMKEMYQLDAPADHGHQPSLQGTEP